MIFLELFLRILLVLVISIVVCGVFYLMLPKKFSSKKKRKIAWSMVFNCLLPPLLLLVPLGILIYSLMIYTLTDLALDFSAVTLMGSFCILYLLGYRFKTKENCKFIFYGGKDPQYVENGRKITPPLGEWKLKNLIENIKRDIGWYAEF